VEITTEAVGNDITECPSAAGVFDFPAPYLCISRSLSLCLCLSHSLSLSHFFSFCVSLHACVRMGVSSAVNGEWFLVKSQQFVLILTDTQKQQ